MMRKCVKCGQVKPSYGFGLIRSGFEKDGLMIHVYDKVCTECREKELKEAIQGLKRKIV